MSGEKVHDNLFKHTFSQLPAAREQLRAQLPEEIVRLIRWETLQLQPGSFVDTELAALHTDLLFHAELEGKGNTYLYLLFEHQSTPDPLLPLRLLRYMNRIWQRWLDDNDKALPLPWLVPLVLYNGQQHWNVAQHFAGLFPERNRTLFAPFLPDFTYRFQDLCRTDDGDLRGEVLRTLTLSWMKRGHEDGFWHKLPDYLSALKQLRDSTGALRDIEVLLRYLVLVNPRKIPDDIKRRLANDLAPQTERWWMTWAEQLKEEGREEGRKEQERLLAKVRQRTLSSLRRRFGPLPDEVVRKVETATEELLDIIDAGLDTADTLEALLD